MAKASSTPKEKIATVVHPAPVLHVTFVPTPIPQLYRGAESSEGNQRACALTPCSVPLLSHFMMRTASNFAMGPLETNPFATLLVPLASNDDTLMHGLLALSGANLTAQDSTLPMQEDVISATAVHYSRLLTGMQKEFATLAGDDFEKMERLLLLVIVACHYEAVSGNTSGAMFNHLLASHHLIASLVKQGGHKVISDGQSFSTNTLGFSIEAHTYLMLCNTLFMPRAYPYQISEVMTMSFEQMARFPTFGSLFAGAHELYQLIPEIEALATSRLLEEQEHADKFATEPSASLKASYDHLRSRIIAWTLDPPSDPNDRGWELRKISGEAWRHALLIRLLTALAGSVVPAHMIRPEMVSLVVEMFVHVRALLASGQNYFATLLWPVLIGSSCVTQVDAQLWILSTFRETWAGQRHIVIWADVLELMWADPDPRAYGPYGLRLVMEKHGKIVGIV